MSPLQITCGGDPRCFGFSTYDSRNSKPINLNQIIELTKGTVLKTRKPGAYNQSVVQFYGLQSETFFALKIVVEGIKVALLLASPLLYIQHS